MINIKSYSLSPTLVRYLLIFLFIFASLFFLQESLLLPIAFTVLSIILILIIKYPKYGILFMYLTKPILDATYFFKLPYIGLNFLQMTGVMFPVFSILILINLKSRISDYYYWRIILLLIVSAVLSFLTYLFGFIHLGGTRLLQLFVSGLVILFQFTNGLSAYFLIPQLFREEKDRKLFLKILIWATLFPLITAYLQIFGIIEGRTLRTTGQLIRISGLYHDSTNLRFYSFQAIACIIIYLSIYKKSLSIPFRLILLTIIGLFIFIIYLGYSKAAIAIILSWSLAYLLISRNIVLGGFSLFAIIFLYMTVPRISYEIDKLFYKEIMFYEGTLSEELEYTLLGGRFVRWEVIISRFENSDILHKILGFNYTIGIVSHNDFLRVLASYGLFGFVIYSIFLLSIIFQTIRQYFVHRDGLAFGSILFLIAFMIDSTGLTPSIYTGYSWVVFGIISLSINRHIGRNKTNS